MKPKILLVTFFSFYFVSCSSLFNTYSSKPFKNKNQTFHSGFIIADSTGKIVKAENEKNLFTPASVLKLYHLPFFLNLKTDSKYLTTGFSVKEKNDSLQISIFSNGDPLLNSHELDSIASIIKRDSIPVSSVTIYTSNYDSSEFWGNGWMWDDEPADYQSYLNGFPVDENTVTISYYRQNATDNFSFDGIKLPVNFSNGNLQIKRIRTQNKIEISRPDSQINLGKLKKIFSFRNPDSVISGFISEIFQTQKVSFQQSDSSIKSAFNYSIVHPFDSLMTRILTYSSNFCAEQTIRYSAVKNGTLGNIKNGLLIEKQSNPKSQNRIVDGSGLSRYNLVSPESILKMISEDSKINKKWFAKYANKGTLRDRLELNNQSITIYAKSGTMTGIQNLAGFVFRENKFIGYAFLFTNNTIENKESRNLFEKEFLDYAVEILN